MKTAGWVLPFLFIACLCLTSCGGKVLESEGGYVLVGSTDGNNIAGVGFGGTVTMVGNCLGVDEVVTIWPPRTSVVSSEPLVVKVPGLGKIEVGDHVEGGGFESDSAEPPDGIDIPSTCPSDIVFSYFPNL